MACAGRGTAAGREQRIKSDTKIKDLLWTTAGQIRYNKSCQKDARKKELISSLVRLFVFSCFTSYPAHET